MTDLAATKIDGYSHIAPPKYTEALREEYPNIYERIVGVPTMFDIEARLRMMDAFAPLAQVLTVGPVPPLEVFAEPKRAVELARLANDEMAELVEKYPERFVAAIALLPMNDIEAAITEAERAVKELGLRGIYVHSNINGKPLDSPEFLPLFEMMATYDLPVYIHPYRGSDFPDYQTESESRYAIASSFGWPYETTAAMTRIAFSGLFERLPGLKVVTHHLGGMVSLFAQRIVHSEFLRGLKKPPLDYYKMFYVDTAIHDNTPALMLGYSFWGPEHIELGSDIPLGDPEFGLGSYAVTLRAIEAMDISEAEKRMILGGNVIRLLKLKA
jgi:predicted TIM-barrel fold metal-dependent hydrolase